MQTKHKKQHNPSDGDGQSGGGWQVVYSGFVLIMLCFFIMLSSFASIEQGRVVRFVKSFVNAVSIFSGGLSLESGKRVLPKSVELIDKESELADIYGQVKEMIEKSRSTSGLEVLNLGKGVVMRLDETVIFAKGKAEVLPAAKPLLDRLGALIAKTDHAVRIEGHTDSDPIHTVRFPSNWELSTSRAVGVLRYLIDKRYVTPSQISAEGFSQFRPIAPNDTAENKAKNRRVEIILLKKRPDTGRAVR